MEKISLHRALSELKILKSRIDNAVCDGEFVVPSKSNSKIKGMTQDQVKSNIQSDYDKVIGLMDRYQKIKSALLIKNATTIIEVAKEKMTIAEAIEKKRTLVMQEEDFLLKLKRIYANSQRKVEEENNMLPSRLESYLSSVLGDKSSAEHSEVEMHTKSFMSRNSYELIDPINIREKIETLEERISSFKSEVDACISEANALNFIEI